ncbi:MAG: CvpA family protein [Clostridiales Family XIII bacterium]|nr:CvpA family protein [Clostridiales Family XIII bacterium]
MQFDLIVAFILLVFIGIGFKNGAVYTLFHVFGWLVSLLVAIFTHRFVENFLRDHTGLYASYYAKIEELCEKVAGDQIASSIEKSPSVLADSIENLAKKTIYNTALAIADVTFAILIFIAIIILVKLLMFLLTRLFSKRHREGFTGAMDGLMGALLGAVQGLCLVFVLLTLFAPATLAIKPDSYEDMNRILNRSMLTKILYNRNPIIKIAGDDMPEGFVLSDYLDPDQFASFQLDEIE